MPMKNPPHPGRSIFRDCIEPMGMSVEEAASALNVSPDELLSLIKGDSPITFSLAVRLDRLFGGGPSTWYELQANYDKAQKTKTEDKLTESEPRIVRQQTFTVPLDHGRVVYTTYDAEVVALDVVPSNDPKLSGDPNYDRVEFRFVGEGPGVIQIQMIYQPSVGTTPRVVADSLLQAYLTWDDTHEEYVGHIDAEAWNREWQKQHDGKYIMNALHAGLRDSSSVPVLSDTNDVSDVKHRNSTLARAGELMHKGTETAYKINDIVRDVMDRF